MNIKKHNTNTWMSLFLPIVFFSQTLIYAIYALFGKSAGGHNAYIYLAIFLLSWVSIFVRLFQNRAVKKNSILGLFICIIIIIHYLITTETGYRSLYYFVLWGVTPLMLVGVADTSCIRSMVKNVEVINLVQSLATIITIVRFYISGNRIVNYISFGGETYNTVSYVSATCVGLFLYYLYFCDDSLRYSLFRKEIVNPIYWGLIILNVFVTLLSGGRGGAILLLVYIIIGTMHFNKVETRRYKRMVFNTFVLTIIVVAVYEAYNNAILQRALARTFSYLSSTGFDITQTSYRDLLYREAIELWLNKPIFGYGPLNYPNMNYPHNLFLDLLVTGGILYFSLGLILVLRETHAMITTFKRNDGALLMTFIFISTLVMLMFSGTFYTNVRFWGCSGYFVYIYNKTDNHIKSISARKNT